MNRPSLAPLGLPIYVWRLLLAAAVVVAFMLTRASAAAPCPPSAPCPPPEPKVFLISQPTTESWVFARSRYTHDPETGARVAQYVDEAADRAAGRPAARDQRLLAQPHRDPRPRRLGRHHYRVTNFGNGRGGMDAEWERFHDAWRGSTIAGGQSQAYFPHRPLGMEAAWGGGGGWDGGGNGWGGGGAGWGTAVGELAERRLRPRHGPPRRRHARPRRRRRLADQRRRTPDRQFFNPGLPPFRDLIPRPERRQPPRL